MKVNFFRTASLFTAFSLPLASGCTTREDQSGNDVQVVKPVEVKLIIIKSKEVLDTERLSLEKQEGKTINSLHELENSFFSALFYLPTISPKEQRVKALRMLTEVTNLYGQWYQEVASTPKEKIPNEDLTELFVKVIKITDAAIPLLEPYSALSKEEFNTKMSKGCRDNDFKEEFILRWTKEGSEQFTLYKISIGTARQEVSKLIQDMEKFNEDAKAAGQAPYKERWISLELLKSLKSIR